VALLTEVVKGLKNKVGATRWSASELKVRTSRKENNDGWGSNKLGADWPDSNTRDQVLRLMLQGTAAAVTVETHEKSALEHSRVMEVEFSTGRRLTIRFDQGVGYWRVPHSTHRNLNSFNFSTNDLAQQCSRLTGLTVRVEGQSMPTQIFLKIR
jgi:hypothetical protein